MNKCEICNKQFKSLCALSKHIKFTHHMNKLYYYNQYMAMSPLEGYCATCGCPTEFLNLRGYKEHCSNRCAQKDPKILAKIHTEEHEKHVSEGVRRSYNKETQNNRIKHTIQNNLIKYGVTNVSQRKDVQEKMKNTIRNKYEQFCIDNDCVSRKYLIQKYGSGWLKLNLPVLKCGNAYFIENKYITLIDKYHSKSSIYENIIYDFLTKIYDGAILRHNRPEFLYGKELDFYLPDINLAIEYNGSYYHCVGNNVGVQTKEYHYEKSRDCFLANVRLIHIFEFESLFTELMLLKSLIYYGIDRYDTSNPNKFWELDDHIPKIIGTYHDMPIYSA